MYYLRKCNIIKFMQRLLRIVILLVAICIGIYIGLYQCIIIAIPDIVNGIKNGFELIPISIGIGKVTIGSQLTIKLMDFRDKISEKLES